MTAPPRTAIVVPCYVEAARLSPTAFLAVLATRPWLSLLFVDDGSDDGTFAVLEAIERAAGGQVRVRRLATHRGKAEAVRSGIVEAGRSGVEYVGFWDADLATPLEAVDDFVAAARRRSHVDLFLGSRVLLMGRDIRRGSLRHYVSRVFATAASNALDLPVYDTQCGAKLFKTTADVLTVFDRAFHSRWVFDIEILERYVALPVTDGGPPRRDRIYEVTLAEWHEVRGSKLRWWDFLLSFGEVFAVWRRRIRSN